ncbi:MAG: hypothetical protein V4438_00220 [Patescibacteria group bacterium]
MINRSIFKAYDVRGIYPADVNIESVGAVARALTHIWNAGKIVIAHDGRHGSVELAGEVAKQAIISGKALGKDFDIISAGLSTTPMFYFLVNKLQASGGAMITASHNPKEYNGVKAVKAEAEAISGTELLEIVDGFESKSE